MQVALSRLQQQEADNARLQRAAQEASQVMPLASCMLLCLLLAKIYIAIRMVHMVYKAQSLFWTCEVVHKMACFWPQLSVMQQ